MYCGLAKDGHRVYYNQLDAKFSAASPNYLQFCVGGLMPPCPYNYITDRKFGTTTAVIN